MPSVYAGLVHPRRARSWRQLPREHTGAAGSLQQYGLSLVDPSNYGYSLDEVDATAGLPAGSTQSLANILLSGADPGQMAVAVDTAIVTMFGGPVAGLAVGAVLDLVQWLAGGTPTPPVPCTMPGCPSVAQGSAPCTGYQYTDVYDPTLYSGIFGPDLAGSFMQTTAQALLNDWAGQMKPTGATSHDIGVCGRVEQGIDPKTWALRHLAAAFPLILKAWNATNAGPATSFVFPVRQTLTVEGQTVYDAPASTDPVSMAVNQIAISAGLQANSSITYTVNSPNGMNPKPSGVTVKPLGLGTCPPGQSMKPGLGGPHCAPTPSSVETIGPRHYAGVPLMSTTQAKGELKVIGLTGVIVAVVVAILARIGWLVFV